MERERKPLCQRSNGMNGWDPSKRTHYSGQKEKKKGPIFTHSNDRLAWMAWYGQWGMCPIVKGTELKRRNGKERSITEHKARRGIEAMVH